MTLTATLSGQAEREPFNAETYFANPDQYDVEYRNGEKPLRVIHVPECVEIDERVLSVAFCKPIQMHYENGQYWDRQEPEYDLFMTRSTDPAESLRGKWVVVNKICDSEHNAKIIASRDNYRHIIHLK